MNGPRTDLARNTLGVLFIGMLMLASAWILRPFIAAMIWSAMIVVATWPLMLRVEGWCGRRRAPAVAVMSVVMLVVFLIPVGTAINVISDHAGEIVQWLKGLSSRPVPDAPAWLGGIPFVGRRAVDAWQAVQLRGVPELAARIEPYAQAITGKVLAEISGIGLLFIQLLLIVILSAVFYADGEAWANWLRQFGRRLADERGEQAVVLAGQAIRGVALGVVVTALVQSGLGGVGLLLAGVPVPLLLTAIMFALCIAQLGPILVLLPSTLWLYASDQVGWGTFMLVWTLVVGLMDNFLRPVLIRRGADLPLLLIIGGVVGGLIAFGLVGLFVGPVVLAVTYTLVDAWVRTGPVERS